MLVVEYPRRKFYYRPAGRAAVVVSRQGGALVGLILALAERLYRLHTLSCKHRVVLRSCVRRWLS